MKLKFEKYESGGNDFVLIDNRKNNYNLTSHQIKNICNRNFGVGSDGLIILKKSTIADIKMIHYNSDGRLSTLCGNGTRCLFSFSLSLGIIEKSAKIETSEGVYSATISNRNLVSLKMKNIDDIILFLGIRRGSAARVFEAVRHQGGAGACGGSCARKGGRGGGRRRGGARSYTAGCAPAAHDGCTRASRGRRVRELRAVYA